MNDSLAEFLALIALGALGAVFLLCICKSICIMIGPPDDLK